MTLEALQEENYALYKDILPENYRESFANPDYAVEVLGMATASFYPFSIRKSGLILYMPLRCGL